MAKTIYGQRLLPHVVDEAAKTNPNRIIGMIAKSANISDGFVELTTSQLANAVNYMSWWLEEQIGKSTNFEAVAYLGCTDFRYWAVQYAAIKTGYAALLPSVRDSVANGLEVLESTNCDVVFYASPLAFKAQELKKARPELRIFQIPELDVMMNTPAKPYAYTKTWDEAKSDKVCILHTSGSTGTPKPIYHNNIFYASIDAHRTIPQANGHEVAGITCYGRPGLKYYLGFPLFHLGGLAMSLASIFYEAIMVIGHPSVPPNAKTVCDIIDSVRLQALCLPPSVIEDFVKEYPEEFVKRAHELELILFGGGPLSPEVGDFAAKHVQLDQVIGSTEAAMAVNMSHKHRELWQWFEFHPTHSGVEFEKLPDSDLYEMVIRWNPKLAWLQVIFQCFPNITEYRTKDTFQKHPTKDLWLYKGRNDDVIVLSNGEKFNPVTMEGIINGHPKVKGALVTGARHPQCAVLLEPHDFQNIENLVDEVWPTIEQANKVSPNHAQISRNMVLVTRPDKPFPRASKGTVMRHLANKLYADENDALYEAFEDGTGDINFPELTNPKDLTSVQEFVHEMVSMILNKESIRDDDDLFVQGFDSLQTMQLANNLKAALTTHTDGTHLGPRLIYENPTVEKLAAAVQHIVSPDSSVTHHTKNSEEIRVANMKATFERLAKDLPSKATKQSVPNKEPLTVVLTGSTGSLGYYCLLTMLFDPQIKKVYCLNRAVDAREKFLSRIPENTATLKKYEDKVEFFQSAFGAPAFGLTSAQYDKLMNEADAIIHNAWKVNFNHSLQSFEADHLRGLRNFIDLSLLSPRHPSLNFVSSISTMGNWNAVYPGQTVPERIANDNEWSAALPMGYGESKLVGERLLHLASKAGIPANILRVGQVAGPVRNGKIGVWNHQEWFPSLVKSSKSLGAVPGDLGSTNSIDWIPVDDLAAITVELVHSTSSASSPENEFNVFNLVNPHRVGFETLVPTIVEHFSATLGKVEVVSAREWLAKLEALDDTNEKVLAEYPSLKIMDFYRGLTSSEGEGLFETKATQSKSKTMANLKAISAADIKLWLEQWGY